MGIKNFQVCVCLIISFAFLFWTVDLSPECTNEHLHKFCIQFQTVHLSRKDFLVHLQPWVPRGIPCSLCFKCPEVKDIADGCLEICTCLFKLSAKAAAQSKGGPGPPCSTSFFQNRDTKCSIFFLLNNALMHSNTYLSTTASHSWNRRNNPSSSPLLMP